MNSAPEITNSVNYLANISQFSGKIESCKLTAQVKEENAQACAFAGKKFFFAGTDDDAVDVNCGGRRI